MKTRSFYVMTLRANAKKKDLIKFLEKEWVPALKSCPGCLEVEILADYGDRAGFFVTELWESPESHVEQSSALWGTERVDIWEACSELALIEVNWTGIIVLKTEENTKS